MTDKADDLMARKQHAVRLLENGELLAAKQLCLDICAAGGPDAGMLCMLGHIHGQLGDYQESADYCRKALAIYPEYVEAHYYLGIALGYLGQTEKSLSAFEFVLSKFPDNVEARYEQGLVQMWAGDFDEALTAFRAVKKSRPNHMGAIANEAIVYEKMGEMDTAWDLIKPYVDNGNLDNGIMAVTYGKLAKSIGRQEMAIASLKKVLGQKSLSVQQQGDLHFILGMLYDDLNDYEPAFVHFKEANISKDAKFNVDGFNGLIDSLIERFTVDQYTNAPRSDCQSERPVFVVGMMRSGTSLVEQILSSHSQVYGAGEQPHIDRIARALNEASPQITSLTKPMLNQHAEHYLSKICELNTELLRVVDKMPQNFMHLGYIRLMFPGAKIIHCTRNALDTCLSCYFQNFSVAHAYTFDLEAMGHCYNGYRKIMQHWLQVLGIEVHEVHYESLVADSEKEIKNLLEFCGLDWEAGCIDFHKNKRAVTTASYEQVRQPIYRSSVDRWRNYEKHIVRLMEIIDYP